MGLALTIVGLVAIVFLLQLWIKKTSSKKHKLPPGPIGLPIIGSIHLLVKSPHRALHQLAKRYGPIMHIRIGWVQTIVVSSPQSAELFLKTHDVQFAHRPYNYSASNYMTYGKKNITMSPYGSYWRAIRKMVTIHFLSSMKIQSFGYVRNEELNLFVDYIKEASREGVAVDLRTKVASLTLDISCRMVFGKKFMEKEIDEKGFLVVLDEFFEILSAPNLGDFFPLIAPFDVHGLTKKIKAISNVFDDFLEKIIDEHIQFKFENKTKSFVDVMLEFLGSGDSEYRIGRDNIKALMMDMLLASMDSTSTAIDWTLSEIMRHPRVMKKVQKELEEKVGMDRMVEESDLENLEYLYMVIKETFRLHPIAPLLIPHRAAQDTFVDGFFIPKDSQILINAWAIGRDLRAWSDAEKFLPERFIGRNIDVYGRDFELLPFGSGRRGCLGINLAITMVRLVVAQLLHCFDWKLPKDILPMDLDMSEKMGIVTAREKHLEATPSYRLRV